MGIPQDIYIHFLQSENVFYFHFSFALMSIIHIIIREVNNVTFTKTKYHSAMLSNTY